MTDEILTDDLIFNLIQDFKKKEISMVTRGRILDEFQRRTGFSNNQTIKELGIGKTTFHTWKRFARLGEENYHELLNNGWSPSDVQIALKESSVENIAKKAKLKRIDILLEETKTKLGQFIHDKDYSPYTADRIRELQNVLNRILMRVEIK
jgi:hypothetical protein